MYFNYDIKFYYTLYIGLPSTKFTGICQDKNGGFELANGAYTSGVSVFQCYDLCKTIHDCVAFFYKDIDEVCNGLTYTDVTDGPYTGSGASGYTCYIMPGKIYSF